MTDRTEKYTDNKTMKAEKNTQFAFTNPVHSSDYWDGDICVSTLWKQTEIS